MVCLLKNGIYGNKQAIDVWNNFIWVHSTELFTSWMTNARMKKKMKSLPLKFSWRNRPLSIWVLVWGLFFCFVCCFFFSRQLKCVLGNKIYLWIFFTSLEFFTDMKNSEIIEKTWGWFFFQFNYFLMLCGMKVIQYKNKVPLENYCTKWEQDSDIVPVFILLSYHENIMKKIKKGKMFPE